jgi:Nuclear transport factor 2 (NTF2) domain.
MAVGPAVWRQTGDTGRTPDEFGQGELEMTGPRERAANPEDLTRLFVECGNAGDAEGLAALYEPDAVVAFPPGKQTVGREAIRALYEQMLSAKPSFRLETPLPTLYVGDIALTATPALDEAGARAQVVRRQPDGTWLRVLDRPDFRG